MYKKMIETNLNLWDFQWRYTKNGIEVLWCNKKCYLSIQKLYEMAINATSSEQFVNNMDRYIALTLTDNEVEYIAKPEFEQLSMEKIKA